MKFSATLFAALTSLTIVSAANLPSMFRRSSNLPICERSITLSNDYAEDAFKKCKELGIDPLGSPPNDFTSDDRGVITFDGDSKYALWHAAQNARTDDLRRRGSDIGVTCVPSLPGCCRDGRLMWCGIGCMHLPIVLGVENPTRTSST